MQTLIVVIEKEGNCYTAYSPNLLGVKITANSREAAEKEILSAVEKRVNELSESYSLNTTVATSMPVEETVPCVAKAATTWRGKCLQPAKKDGLCWQHWKKAFGHAFGTKINLRACPLCGESDSVLLNTWDSPCSFKAENRNWSTVYEKMKIEKREVWKQESKELELEKLKGKSRCSRMLTTGEQCTKAADRGDLCFSHAFRDRERSYKPPLTTTSNAYDPKESARNYFKYRNLR